MGGACRYGDYFTLQAAMKAWEEEIVVYVYEYHLFLRYGRIEYDSETLKYKLAMRFTK